MPLTILYTSQNSYAARKQMQMPSPLHDLSYPHIIPNSLSIHLVLRRSLLACLQLVQIPSANRQAALVLIHAFAEVVDVSRACTALCRCVDLLVLLRKVGVLGRVFGGRGRGAAAEPAAYCVAD